MRTYQSNGPDQKIHGTPAQIAEKYMSLARDALSSGDPVLAENYLQHAEHYNRIILTYREQQVQQGGDVVNGGGNRTRQFPGSGAEGLDAGSDMGDDDRDEIGIDGLPISMRGSEPQPRMYDQSQGRTDDRPRQQGDQYREQGRDRDRDNNRDQNREHGRDQNRDHSRDQNKDQGRDQGRDHGHGQQRDGNRGFRPRTGGDQQRFSQDRNDRGGDQRGDRNDRGGRGDRPERNEGHDRPERNAEPRNPEQRAPEHRNTDRGDRQERPHRSPPADRQLDRQPDRHVERHEPAADRSAPAPVERERVIEPVVAPYVEQSLPAAAAIASDVPTAAPPARRRERFVDTQDQPEFLRRPVRRPRREAAAVEPVEGAAPIVRPPVREPGSD